MPPPTGFIYPAKRSFDSLIHFLVLDTYTTRYRSEDPLFMKSGGELRNQFFHIWQNWTAWAVTFPDKRRALAQLSVSDEITPETRAAGHKMMAGIAELLEQIRANGPMRKVPMNFVAGIMNSVAEATMDFMAQDPASAKKHCKVGFDALWRVIA